ncbi:MAG: hypothetical protein GW775_00015 [Candidatus Magasanikbacteria bacterium]|nr:hypothetical protein [Candidatus Magasanikbacteria bacterium]
MLFHLNLMLWRIEEVCEGIIPKEIPSKIRRLLRRAIKDVPQELLELYVFLHDIDKTTHLFLTFEENGQEDFPVTLDLWIEMLCGDEDGHAVLGGDTNALSWYCHAIGIRAIGYQGHDKASAVRLEALDTRKKDLIIMVRYHEVAFQFNCVNIPAFEELFGTMSPKERDMCMLASFIDTAASLRENGRPDFTNFLFFARSRLAAEAFDELCLRLQDEKNLDEHKLRKALTALRKSPEAFQDMSVEEVFHTFVKECRRPEVTPDQVREALAPQIATKRG